MALPCRYICLKALLNFKSSRAIGHICISHFPLLIYDLQSHPAFAEYHDLLEDLEEKLASVANLEEK